jgi:hypothetical protein
VSERVTAEDCSQLGLSEQGSADREYIREELGLKDLQDAYRLGVAVALAKNLPPAQDAVRRTTRMAQVSLMLRISQSINPNVAR